MKLLLSGISLVLFGSTISFVDGINGGISRIETFNGWKAFEVISEGDRISGWTMPSTFDGAGAFLSDSNSIRVQVNHETSEATVSEVNLDLGNLKTAISNMINNGNTGGVEFVKSASQAYDKWSSNGGETFRTTTTPSSTDFYRFCSAQAYAPNTFGLNRGFVDQLYITGEEGGDERLFALDSANRAYYQLSGVVGSDPNGGNGGMPFDSWENAALIDTGKTSHIALLLSPDGGSYEMKIYIGIKGKDLNGNPSSSFLARNGLAYGSWYYLNADLPESVGSTNNGFFDTSSSGALSSNKLEDVDTSPTNPTKVVLGDQDSGAFVFDFDLKFTGGAFNADKSSFTLTMIDKDGNGLGSADNVEWTAATTLNGQSYPEGLIFVNEDNSSGEIWRMKPDGTDQLQIGRTTVDSESSGIFDLSDLVGYNPGSILVTSNQGDPASMTVLINPEATLSGPPPTPSPTNPTIAPSPTTTTPTTENPTGTPTTEKPTSAPTTTRPTTPPPPSFQIVRIPCNSDVEEGIDRNGNIYANSTDLELGFGDNSAQIIGLRYRGVPIPQGAPIIDAYIEFQADEEGLGDSPELRFHAHDVDYAPRFRLTRRDVSKRKKTRYSAYWGDMGDWVVGREYKSPNLKYIVQEVVDRSGWEEGNALVFMIYPENSDSINYRTAESNQGRGGPKLVIEYFGPEPGQFRQGPDDESDELIADEGISTVLIAGISTASAVFVLAVASVFVIRHKRKNKSTHKTAIVVDKC